MARLPIQKNENGEDQELMIILHHEATRRLWKAELLMKFAGMLPWADALPIEQAPRRDLVAKPSSNVVQIALIPTLAAKPANAGEPPLFAPGPRTT